MGIGTGVFLLIAGAVVGAVLAAWCFRRPKQFGLADARMASGFVTRAVGGLAPLLHDGAATEAVARAAAGIVLGTVAGLGYENRVAGDLQKVADKTELENARARSLISANAAEIEQLEAENEEQAGEIASRESSLASDRAVAMLLGG